MSVAFVGPADSGGAAVTNYEYSTDNGATWVARNPVSVVSPVLVGGLTNGVTYQLKLRAVNAAGAGAPSVAVAVTPKAPVTVPGAPTGVGGVAGAGKVVVSWVAPAFDGGAPISGYTVTSSPGGKSCTTAGALTCEVTGLSNGTGYTFTVVEIGRAHV